MPGEKTPTLEEIIAHKRRAVAGRKAQVPLSAVRAQARMQQRPLDIVSHLRSRRLTLVAHLQAASLESGRILRPYDPVGLARLFAGNGAAGLSIATEERFFQGGLDHLTLVKRAVDVPVWAYDFIIEPYQVYEARAAGADGALLMAHLLADVELRALVSLTQRLKMTELLVVRNEAEMARVAGLDPRVVIITTRDPVSGAVDLGLPARLRAALPAHTTVLAMGGFKTAADMAQAADAGVDGVVVGRALMTADDKAGAFRAFVRFAAHAQNPVPAYRRGIGAEKP